MVEFTKEHYGIIAKAMQQSYPNRELCDYDTYKMNEFQWDITCDCLAAAFAQHDKTFDPVGFKTACKPGVGT